MEKILLLTTCSLGANISRYSASNIHLALSSHSLLSTPSSCLPCFSRPIMVTRVNKTTSSHKWWCWKGYLVLVRQYLHELCSFLRKTKTKSSTKTRTNDEEYLVLVRQYLHEELCFFLCTGQATGLSDGGDSQWAVTTFLQLKTESADDNDLVGSGGKAKLFWIRFPHTQDFDRICLPDWKDLHI